MSVNNIRIVDINETYELNIPLESSWDFNGIEEGYKNYEESVIKEILNIGDFETTRFEHQEYNTTGSSINYEFNFFNTGNTTYENSYLAEFSAEQVFYFVNQFSNSFFKLDFYNTPDTSTQKNYFTIILPVQQGLVESAILNPSVLGSKVVSIKKPFFVLDYIGDKEGFFIYWLKKRDFIDLSTFYMSAKFFDARIGVFIKMMTESQTSLSSQTNFNPTEYFYYKLELDYNARTYRVVNNSSGVRVGTNINPIRWYEYINP